ncbi:MAG: phosphatase PAP2 family protein [Anaerolineae bacterium]|nr:phosphatase PAP2 family protein [Anaerolineae bacterium]
MHPIPSPNSRRIAARIALLFLAGVIGIALFVLISETILDQQAVLDWDTEVAQDFYDARRPALTDAADVLDVIGSAGAWVWGIGLGALLIVRREWRLLAVWALVIGGGKLVNIGLKDWFERPRPVFEDVSGVAEYSYPSGHATMAALVYGMLAYLVWQWVRDRRARIAAAAGALTMILVIGLSRLVLVVHFPSDVIGGWIAGGLWVGLCVGIHRAVLMGRR